MKKMVTLLVAVAMLIALAGCATSNQSAGNGAAESTAPVTDQQADNSTSEPEVELLAAPPTTKEGPIKLAFVPSVMNVYYDQVLSGIKEEVDKLGGSSVIEVLIHAPTSNSTSVNEQIDIMESLIEQEVDAIAISAESDEPLTALFKQAAEAGIAVFEFNMPTVDLTSEYYVSNIGYDQFVAGRLIGEWAVKYFDGKPTKTAILEGFPGTLNTQRVEGFLEGLKGHDNFEIVFQQTANWNRHDGQSVTENMLQAYPDVNFIAGMYDEMSLGAYNAVKAEGLEKSIIIAGYDMTQEGYDSILAGQLGMSVDNGAKNIGRSIAISAYQYCMKGKMVDRVIDVGSIAYDSSNINEFNVDDYTYVKQEPIAGYLD